MNQITLQNDGSIIESNKTVPGDSLMILGCQVELAQGYTLRSFFRMFEKYTLLEKLDAFVADCIQRYLGCPKDHCTSDDIDHLEFYKTGEMIGFPGEPRLEIYHTLSGVRGTVNLEIKLFHLESLLDMPLKLGVLKHIVFGDKVDEFEFETVFNLFEFIGGIIWELSFQGTPKECAI
jgi:hypothetical protein